MAPLAHSARPDLGIPVQFYRDHVRGVIELASRNASEAARYWRQDRKSFREAVRVAAEYHDLGKLEAANQDVLTSGSRRRALPVNHVDAGVAHLLSPAKKNLLAATLVYAHHVGLPDFQDQRCCGEGEVLRDLHANESGQSIKSITDRSLGEYLELHEATTRELNTPPSILSEVIRGPLPSLLFRIALSCLVDADHYDTSRHYREAVSRASPSLWPDVRSKLLDKYVAALGNGQMDQRDALRDEVYRACSSADPGPWLYACDSPVGTGKTTAVMAHLLHAAMVKKLRRIFVVLPFTNIIDQSVEIYRKALTRPGERGEDVVAAHHHRAEFESLESRHLSFLWKAPIVVTTAVQFFETLASNRPGSLRKLHELPGSAIFLDEVHAALPAHLWPQAWKWLRELESEWGSHFVLGSGSLNRFWELEEFSEAPVQVPELIPPIVKFPVARYEKSRITYHTRSGPLTKPKLLEWVPDVRGPRLLIVNTVQSAAVLAEAICEMSGRESVEHLSTSLCPRDRKITLERVKKRIADPSDDNWTLVATSCVEAGVNLSFRNGFRERCSLNSLIQVGGRVNRGGEYSDSRVWDFELQHDGFLKAHPAFEASARILSELFSEGNVGAEFSTEAMRREIRQQGVKDISEIIMKAEKNLQFPTVSQKFTVIDTDTITVIVDRDLVEALEKHQRVHPFMLQSCSVQIWFYKKGDYDLSPVAGFRDLYPWTLLYDDFLGYMAGVLQKMRHEEGGTII